MAKWRRQLPAFQASKVEYTVAKKTGESATQTKPQVNCGEEDNEPCIPPNLLPAKLQHFSSSLARRCHLDPVGSPSSTTEHSEKPHALFY
jgi:hypothetical protein